MTMRVLLVSANTEQVNMPTLPVGLWGVAAAARGAGHEVVVLDAMHEADPEAAVARAAGDLRPDVIGVSVRNIDDQRRLGPTFFLDRLRRLVAACRAASPAPIVLGGAGYSIFPVAALDDLGADYGIQGEGEVAMPALLRALESGDGLERVPGLFTRARDRGALGPRVFVHDLDELPWPDEACLASLEARAPDPARPLWVPIQTRRGCPLRCAYCSTEAIEGARVRARSVGAMVDWLARHPALAAYPLYFVDNNFNLPRDYAAALCRGLVERGLRLSWRCIFNPSRADEELLSLMAAAGCREVSLGIEAGTAETIAALHKPFHLDQVRRAAALLRHAGIRTMGFLLLGGPGETRATVEASLAFVDELGLDAVKVTAGIRLYPATPLARRALDEGVIDAADSLLRPRFYLAPGLEPWLDEALARWAASHPGWVV